MTDRGPLTLVITGTSRGIGMQLAKHYLNLGHRVIGCSRGNDTIDHEGYTHHSLDVSDEGRVSAMFSSIRQNYGSADALINNAGTIAFSPLMLASYSTIENTFRTNVFGTFLFTREYAKMASRAKSGRIVNISTIAVPLHLEGETVYASSKAAVETMSRIASKELAAYGITCNTIGLAPTDTDLLETYPAEKIDALVQGLPVKRRGLLRDIINTVDFLISDSSDAVTGQTIYLGGAF